MNLFLKLPFVASFLNYDDKKKNDLAEPKEPPILGSKDQDDIFMEGLILNEGKVPHVYKDTKGLYTIGIGTLVDKSMNAGLTDDEMLYLARNRARLYAEELDLKIPWWRDLSPVRQRVILELAYNMGVGNRTRGLLSFYNTLPAIQRGDYKTAVAGLERSKWAKDVGPNRTARLTSALLQG